MLQLIDLGIVTGDKKGDGAKTAGKKINDNLIYLEGRINNSNKLISQTGFALAGTILTINAGWQWIINGITFSNPVAVEITFPLASAGMKRIDLVVLNTSNTFSRIVGDEATVPFAPSVVEGVIAVSFSVITDTLVGEFSEPIIYSDSTKTDKGGYTGTSQNLKDSITALETPDIVLKEGVIAIDELTVSIVANDFQWRLNQVNYLVTPAYSQLLVAATEGFKRTDLLEGDDTGNYFINQGTEGEFAAPAPVVTVGRIRLAAIPVFGSVVGTPDVGAPVESSPTDKPISVYGVFDKGISLYKDKISIWRYIGVISKYVNIYWSNINNIYDIQFPNKPAGTETFAMLSDLESKLDISDYNNHFKGVYLTEAALIAAHPTASVGDYAQVNEVGATDVVNYNWDAEENIWVKNITEGGSSATNTDELPEGTANLYFTTARVLSTLLSGLSLVTGGTIVSTDSVLVAFGKVQKQINDISTSLSAKQDKVVAVRQISSATALADSDHGLIIILTASCTVTIPNGLMANFECTLVTLAGATLTIAQGSSVSLLNNAGTTMAEKLSFTLKNTLTTNQYLTAGNL
jgi:hypothetical protein